MTQPINSIDSQGYIAVPTEQYIAVGNPKIYLPVSAANPLPVNSAINDGAIVTQGAKADTAVIDPTLSASEMAILKGLLKQLQGAGTGATPVTVTGSLANITGHLASVTTPGTRVNLPNNPCVECTVIARKGNTGNIYVGGNDVSSTVYGVTLAANESFTFRVANTNQIYIDAANGGEGISYVAL